MTQIFTARVVENGFLLSETAADGSGEILRMWVASSQEDLARTVAEILDARRAAEASRGIDSIR